MWITENKQYLLNNNFLQKIKLPKIIGHRGACGIAPENTMSSLIEASKLNLSFVEIDVKVSKDLIPILFHDENY